MWLSFKPQRGGVELVHSAFYLASFDFNFSPYHNFFAAQEVHHCLASAGAFIMSAAVANASRLKPEIRLAQAVSQFEADLSSEQKATVRT